MAWRSAGNEGWIENEDAMGWSGRGAGDWIRGADADGRAVTAAGDSGCAHAACEPADGRGDAGRGDDLAFRDRGYDAAAGYDAGGGDYSCGCSTWSNCRENRRRNPGDGRRP